MLEHISATQLNMYLRCPASYRYRYVEGIMIPPGSSLTKGRAVHKGQEHNYRQKVETFEDRPLDEVREVTATAFEAEQDNTKFTADEKPGEVKDQAVILAALYHQEVAPTVQPVLVEEKFEVPIEGTTLLGFMDLVDSRAFIRDTKTSSKSPAQGEADKSLQLTAYALGHRHIMGMPEAGVKLDYLVQNKTPKAVTLESRRTEADIQRLTRIISSVLGAIRSNAFFPNPGNFLCSEKFCGYWKICHHDY